MLTGVQLIMEAIDLFTFWPWIRGRENEEYYPGKFIFPAVYSALEPDYFALKHSDPENLRLQSQAQSLHNIELQSHQILELLVRS